MIKDFEKNWQNFQSWTSLENWEILKILGPGRVIGILKIKLIKILGQASSSLENWKILQILDRENSSLENWETLQISGL